MTTQVTRRLEKRLLARGGPAAAWDAGRLGQGLLHVGHDRPLGARGHDRLAQAVDVHVGAPAVAAIRSLQWDEGKDAIGPDELSVAEWNHAGVALGHRLVTIAA